MATPRYNLDTTLPTGHNNSIVVLQFSPDGKFLASGSGDGVLMVFSTSTWKPVKRYIDASSITTMVWHPTFPKTLICGYRSGDVHTVNFESHALVNVHVTSHSPLGSRLQIDDCNKVWSDKMGDSINCIAIDETGVKVALSYGSNVAIVEQYAVCESNFMLLVAIAESTTIAVWTNPRNLSEPPSLPGVDEELPNPTACSLHFVEGGRALIVSYIDHGIV